MITGLGGVFIKANEPKLLAKWYQDNLGIGFQNSLYFSFKWRELSNPENISHTVFSFFEEDSTYFYPGSNDVMINLRVNDLDNLRIQLKNNGVFVVDKIETYEYGRFGWVLDPVGNKIELWEPIDDGFGDRKKPMDLINVTGLGGVFLKCPNPEQLMKWYAKQFGLFFNYSAHSFKWKDLYDKNYTGNTLLSFFSDTSTYFNPSTKNYMLNFRVKNLKVLLEKLRSTDAVVLEKTEKYEYGSFGWLLDPEGNKIELWEPGDESLIS